MAHLGIHNRDGGAAAQTGSAAHAAIAAWHKNGKEVDKAIATMKKLRDQFPLADFLEAERLFQLYAADERNQKAKVIHAEYLFHGEIAKGIVLEGTCDQIRDDPEKGWSVWDAKTSRLSGPLIRDQHTYQVAAYAVLASKRFRRIVVPGGIIMIRGYESKAKDKVWYPYNLTLDAAKKMMEAVADRVRDVRAGRLQAVPGDHCGYCIGTQACMEKLLCHTSVK